MDLLEAKSTVRLIAFIFVALPLVAAPDDTPERQWARWRFAQYWLPRLEAVCENATPIECVDRQKRLVLNPGPSQPGELLFEGWAIRERRSLYSSLIWARVLLDSPESPPDNVLRSVLQRLRRDAQIVPPTAAMPLFFPDPDPRVMLTSKVSSFPVVRTQPVKNPAGTDGIDVIFQNRYTKTVSVFVIGFPGDPSCGWGVIGSPDTLSVVRPGETAVLLIRTADVGRLQLKCVRFDDGTADGDRACVDELNQFWLGIRTFKLSYTSPLHQLLVMPPDQLHPAIEALIARLKADLGTAASGSGSCCFSIGEHSKKEALLGRLEWLRTLPPGHHPHLRLVVEQFSFNSSR